MPPLTDLSRLGRHIAKQQDALSSDYDPDESQDEFVARLADRRSTSGNLRGVLAGLAVAAVAAGALLFYPRRTLDDLHFYTGGSMTPGQVGTWVSASGASPAALLFSDGTRVTLQPGARGRVAQVNPNGAEVVIEQGRASFDVIPRAGNRWQVRTGPFVVQVTGTRFDVEWRPATDTFALDLLDGHVLVSGCSMGNGQNVKAGQRVEASCVRNEARVTSMGQSAEVPGGPPKPSSLQQPSESLAGSEPVTPRNDPPRSDRSAVEERASVVAHASWIALAHQGRYADAYAAAHAAGVDGSHLGSDELLLLGDSARVTSHLGEARRVYQMVRTNWPGTPAAALAAFQLGREDFDQRRDYSGAETWLKVYLSEQPRGPFAAPALGRLMEAELLMGHHDSAREMAKRYLGQYPTGPHADAAKKLLASASPPLSD